MERRRRVVVVGGGVGGLAAADHLAANGCTDFVVLEARNRTGGRVVSIPLAGDGSERVELGANWIHGVLGNPMFELAISNGLVDVLSSSKPHQVIAASEDGSQVPFAVLKEIYEAYVCFLRRCEEYFICQYLPPQDVNSVGEHIRYEAALYLDRLSLASPNDRTIRRKIFDCLLKRETCISGCHSMNEIDLLELGSYTELQGGNVVLPAGYSAILEPLTRHIPPENVKTNRAVTRIRWSSSEADPGDESDDSDRTVIEDSPKTPPPDVIVECDNGETYCCDHVICAIPLGVLKEKAAAMFTPPLPAYKTDSIDRLLYGTVDKIFLCYDRPFLNPTVSEILLLWESYPDEAPEDIAQNWYKKIYSFSKVSETVILGWISGKEAEYMETLSSDVVSAKCTEILRKFLNDPYVPKPQKCVCTSWHRQPYSRGSYTAIAVGASQIDIEQIAQPLYSPNQPKKPVLLFAGEHTHSNFYSTVHGAYLSGRTAAQQLLLPGDGEEEVLLECNDTNDLSSWIQGMALN